MAVIRPTFPDDHYTRVPNAWLRDPNLDPAPKAYLAYLLSHAAGFRCSTALAARDMGVNRSTVSAWNAKLVERGYFLTVEQSTAERGRFGENDYAMTSCVQSAPPLPENRAPSPREGARSADHRPENRAVSPRKTARSTVSENRAVSPREGARFTDTVRPRTVGPTRSGRHIEEQGEKNTGRRTPEPLPLDVPSREAPRTVDEAFDEFWSAYPKKVDKGPARRAWAKAIRRADPDKIIAAVREYPFDLSRIRYEKNPATWLNAGSWEDDLDAVRAARSNGHSYNLPPRDAYTAGDGTF